MKSCGNLFGRRRRSGVWLLSCGNGRYVISYATLFDVRIFGHAAFHHRFSISSPFIFALFHNFSGAWSVCEWCGGGSRGGAGRIRLGSLRKCGEMLDCYSCQRTTNQAKVIFHLSPPVGEPVSLGASLVRLALPATVLFVTHKPTVIFGACSYLQRIPVMMGHSLYA
jgi:hypothetical protein